MWRRALTAAVLILTVVPLSAASAGADHRSRFEVSVRLTSQTILIGDHADLTGKVRGGIPGTKVRLQRRVAGAWVDRRRAQLARHSTFEISLPTGKARSVQYRVVKPAGRARHHMVERSGHSAPVRLTVYRRLDVSDPADGSAYSYYDHRLSAPHVMHGSWRLGGGALPHGLTLSQDGQITGTPTAHQTATFRLEATGTDGADRVSEPLQMTIRAYVNDVGKYWSAVAAPDRSTRNGQFQDQLFDVDCPATGQCTAVGTYADYSRDGLGGVLVETLALGQWVDQEVPLPPGVTGRAGLSQIDCSDSLNCVAIGSFVNDGNDSDYFAHGLLGVETAGVWTLSVAPTPSAAAAAGQQYMDLTSLACSGPAACVAFGVTSAGGAQHVNEATGVAETLSATTWAATTVDAAHTYVGLAHATCSASECVLIGRGSPQDRLIEGNGSVWSSTAIPYAAPASAEANAVSALRCFTADSCTYIGAEADIGAGGWQGIVGSVDKTVPNSTFGPAVPDVAGNWFYNDLSCTGATWCAAGGVYATATAAQQPDVATYAAGTWTAIGLVVPPSPYDTEESPPEGSIEHIDCPTVDRCAAAGAANAGALLITRDADSWHTFLAPAPSDAKPRDNDLQSLSCASTTFCVSVGEYYTAQFPQLPHGLIETYDGPPASS